MRDTRLHALNELSFVVGSILIFKMPQVLLHVINLLLKPSNSHHGVLIRELISLKMGHGERTILVETIQAHIKHGRLSLGISLHLMH